MRLITTSGLLLVGVLALAACGGGSSHSVSGSSATTTTVPGGGGGFGNRLAGFRTCMANHGITLPRRRRPSGTDGSTPGTGGGRDGGGGFFGGGGGAAFQQPPAGVDPQKYQTALDACRSQLPTGGNFNNSAFQAYRSCLHDHGVTLPAGGQATTGTTFDRAKLRAAMQACRALLPAGFGRNSTTTTTGTSTN